MTEMNFGHVCETFLVFRCKIVKNWKDKSIFCVVGNSATPVQGVEIGTKADYNVIHKIMITPGS